VDGLQDNAVMPFMQVSKPVENLCGEAVKTGGNLRNRGLPRTLHLAIVMASV
jgi:hypothetical protein